MIFEIPNGSKNCEKEKISIRKWATPTRMAQIPMSSTTRSLRNPNRESFLFDWFSTGHSNIGFTTTQTPVRNQALTVYKNKAIAVKKLGDERAEPHLRG